ncbi:MAG: hypothetical protein NZ580_07955, partial [Bacteroidia bacterium]|nr:hypothetical protein [Bacteroidia bacterium]
MASGTRELNSYLQELLHRIDNSLRFYPIQLPFFQLRRHFFLSFVWIVLWLIASGQIGRGIGVPVLFYEPRIGTGIGLVGTLAWGMAYGIFVISYHLTTFLLDGHHAGFLLAEPRPFLQYALNNSLLPFSFWLYYLHHYTAQHAQDPDFPIQLLGHFLGAWGTVWGILWLLDSITKDVFRLSRLGFFPPQRIYVQVSHTRISSNPVRYYLAIPGGIRSTWRPYALDKKTLTRLLLRYHTHTFLLETGLLLLITIWGYIQGEVEIYIPAASTFLVLCATVYMLIGAMAFWLRRWGGWALAGILLLLIFAIRQGWLKSESVAYGLNYEGKGKVRHTGDSLGLYRCIRAWSQRQGGLKAPLVWIQVSGGGWRSAFWSLSNLQLLDSLSQGRLWQRTLGISGASGGLIGAAVWRELGLFYPHRRWDPREAEWLTQDGLNPILSTGLVGLLSPTSSFYDTIAQQFYPQGRGYAFERALVRNSRAFYERRIGDYAAPESTGKCPLLLITPTLLSQYKQLLISSQSCSPLSEGGFITELRQLVPDADHLRMTTALRMNAAFPFVLPPVRLPTSPPLLALDAGAIDNFGEIIALRFLWQMRDSLARYASKIIIIEIRDLPAESTTGSSPKESVLQDFFKRLGGLYTSLTAARRLFTNLAHTMLSHTYPIPIEEYILDYPAPQGYIPPLGFT